MHDGWKFESGPVPREHTYPSLLFRIDQTSRRRSYVSFLWPATCMEFVLEYPLQSLINALFYFSISSLALMVIQYPFDEKIAVAKISRVTRQFAADQISMQRSSRSGRLSAGWMKFDSVTSEKRPRQVCSAVRAILQNGWKAFAVEKACLWLIGSQKDWTLFHEFRRTSTKWPDIESHKRPSVAHRSRQIISILEIFWFTS
jgi:hypothetical protein